MSPEKKVLLLILSLIILMAACVYTHLPQFMNESKDNIVNPSPKVEKVEEKVDETEKEEEKKEEDESVSENETTTETLEEKTTGETIEQASETTEAVEEQVKEEVSEQVVEEVKEEPLITTDERYIREGSEKNIEDLSKSTQELQIKMSEYVKENPVTFKRASYKLTKKSNSTIKVIVESLKEFPNIKIEVAGHTDAVGAAKVNQAISLARAKSVQSRLVYYGIDKDRIIVRGYGEDIPFVKNSPNGYSKVNRRVEFNIVEE